MAMRAAVALILAWILAGSAAAVSQNAPVAPLARHYQAGQKLAYRMTAQNEDWHYVVEARGVVRQDGDAPMYEEFEWSRMSSNGAEVAIRADMATYRQRLSLDPRKNPGPPDLTRVDPKLIGPITDLMTFYVDLWLANKLGALRKAGDHFYFANPMPVSSCADGTRTILGQSAIDFDMTLKSVDAGAGTAVLEVKHVPPAKPHVETPAEWMKTPVGERPNNWVGVTKEQDGTYSAAVGQETFTVEMTLSLADGRIVSATMENPVKTVQRVCKDAALTDCGEAKPHTILRTVAIEAMR